jgi:hypothetical protein
MWGERAEVPTLHILGRRKNNIKELLVVGRLMMRLIVFHNKHFGCKHLRVTSEHMRVPASSAAGEL